MSNYYKDVKTTTSVADAYRSMYAKPNEDILNEELIDSIIEDVREEEINEWLDYLEEDSMMSYPKKNEKKIRPMLMKVAKKHPRVKVSFGTHSKGKFVDDNNINFKGKDKDIDNDGDVDSSDKFLHKKRKAISKAIDKKEDASEMKYDARSKSFKETLRRLGYVKEKSLIYNNKKAGK